MRLLSTIDIRIKKGFLPHLTNEIYKRCCEIRKTILIEDQGEYDHFTLELFYSNREKFKGLLDKISKHGNNFQIISISKDFEDEVTGGLLRVTGKMEVENIMDYEMKVQGIPEFALDLIKNNNNDLKYTGISTNVGLVSGIKSGGDTKDFLLKSYIIQEKDSIIINRFSGLNAFPLVIKYNEPDDLPKTIQRLEDTFSVIRLCDLEEIDDVLVYEQIYSDCTLPVVSRYYDEIPLYLLTTISGLMKKNKLDINDKNAGFIGINASSLRLTDLLLKLGFYRVLGCDNNVKLMHSFEKQGGLATTQENIFNNSDIIILFKDHYNESDLKKTGSGQILISLIDSPVETPGLKERGVREILNYGWMDLAIIFPGILKGLIDSDIKRIDNSAIINLSKKICELNSEDNFFPDVFSDVHEKIAGFIQSLP